MATRGRKPKQQGPVPFVLLIIAFTAFVLSLGTVLRAYAMPVEARTTEPWYGYQSVIGYNFTASVVKGRYYNDAVVKPDQLLKNKVPVDPPLYRRVLISQLTESVNVQIPYYFRGDRPATLNAKFRIDGQMVIPGFWQSPYPFVQQKEFSVNGIEITGTETFVIPVKQLLSDMEMTRKDLGVSIEPLEIYIRPYLTVEVAGLQQPIQVENKTEYRIDVRTPTLDLDDPRESKVEKILSETKIVPITLNILGLDIRVAVLRQISLTALFLFLALGILMLLLRRKKPDSRGLLQRLGTNLLTVRAFELPGDAAIAEVRSAKELIQLQGQTERPVIRVGSTYYLLDGTTCYRYIYTGEKEPEGDD